MIRVSRNTTSWTSAHLIDEPKRESGRYPKLIHSTSSIHLTHPPIGIVCGAICGQGADRTSCGGFADAVGEATRVQQAVDERSYKDTIPTRSLEGNIKEGSTNRFSLCLYSFDTSRFSCSYQSKMRSSNSFSIRCESVRRIGARVANSRHPHDPHYWRTFAHMSPSRTSCIRINWSGTMRRRCKKERGRGYLHLRMHCPFFKSILFISWFLFAD